VGGVRELRRVISGHELLLLDTMVFSYHLSNHPRYAPLATVILEAVEAGDVMGLTTTVALAELLTVPAKGNNRQAMQEYELYLTRFPNLRMVPLDAALARETATVRAATGLRMPDAVQVAAARLSGADGIVTNDRRWAERVAQPALVLLGDYADVV
jgi:predicted nucleic acid-binding protein